MEFLVVGVLLLACALALGLRPSREDFPTRLLAVLVLYSFPVGLAGWALLRPDWAGFLMSSFDPDGFVVDAVLVLIAAGGGVALLPAWGYLIGRMIRWMRCGRTASSPSASSRFRQSQLLTSGTMSSSRSRDLGPMQHLRLKREARRIAEDAMTIGPRPHETRQKPKAQCD
jgi:hypothetical protein